MEKTIESEKTHVENLLTHTREYINTKIDIIKLTAVDKGSSAISSAAVYLGLAVISLFFLMMLSIGAALAISAALDSSYAGFLIVAGIYLLLGILLYVMQDKWVKTPIVNAIIKSFFREGDK
jgi:hypothetical protein